MVKKHVPFERSFASPSEEQLRNPDYLSFGNSRKSGTLSWKELYKYRCVIILGEGKCGKTHEFQQQHKKLSSESQFSFFVPLELLQDHEFSEIISAKEERDYQRWLHETDNEAVFFLDAVDELKLRKGTLRKALRKIKDAIGSQASRARFFVSCRPNDWQEEFDLGEVSALVTVSEKKEEIINTPNGEEIFTAVITHNTIDDSRSKTKEVSLDETVKVLMLLPLTRKEIIEFTTLYEPIQAKKFETYLEDKELWHLYQLPIDIMSALDQLLSEGRLGNLEEQLCFGIGQKLREVSEKKRTSLSEDRAREGAQRIALALFLMKRRSIYLEGVGRDAEGICVADLLTDWAPGERIELLGKALFDPTGVGAVRFHHRSTQEFLAAKRLQTLREAGLSNADLFHLLFADIENEKVIIPSMEPIAAWMALWYPDILTEVQKRNPLLLFRQGLPALLSVELRVELIRRFVQRYSGSEWRRIGVGHQELKRVATPELSAVTRECWELAYTGHDTRELLLELIYLTPMPDCADLAFRAALDECLPSHHRIYAVWAVTICGTFEQKREIGIEIVRGAFPEPVVRNVLPELLPEAIDLTMFLSLARSLKEVPRSVHGLGHALLQAVKSNAISNEQKILIRDDFTQAIWENRLADSRIYNAHSLYDHFIHSVIAACYMILPTAFEENSRWAWSLAVAFHFGERRSSIIAREDTEKLLQVLSNSVSLREAFFWACFDLAEKLEAPNNDWERFIRTDYDRALCAFSQNDIPWLLKALSPEAIEARRGVAFYVLSTFILTGENTVFTEKISELISDRCDLSEELKNMLNPPSREPKQYEIEHIKWKKIHEKKELKRVEDLKKWRQKVLADGDFLLEEANREATLYCLHSIMQDTFWDSGTWCHWNSHFIETAFSFNFLQKLRGELASYWRKNDVQLYSERPKDSRNSYPNSSLIALAALKCNAEDQNWSEALTHEEAIRAVRISTIELNGFASFLPQIEASCPSAVEEVIGKEIQAQVVELLDSGTAPILNEILDHGTPGMQKIAAISIIENMPAIKAAMLAGRVKDIGYAFELVAAHGTDEAVIEAAKAIQVYLESSNQRTITDRNFWLKVLATLDLDKACEYILSFTNELVSSETRDNAISLFAAIFGDRYTRGKLSFDSLEPNHRLRLLKALVIRAFQKVHLQDDLNHEGSYSPNTRDRAEQARDYLLQLLVETCSRKTLSVLYELSLLPEFGNLSDRLKQIATELAARISEPEAMTPGVFRQFDRERNYQPYDNPSLFAVMKNRLNDFEHHLINDEQSIIDTLRKVADETTLRRFVSNWLNQQSRGSYSITQEAVVVAEKRTDIRLHANGLDRYASIEVKLDDRSCKWSGTQLKKALVEQLVGQYLNHERSQIGCLLICMRETRQRVQPDTGIHMDLKATVAWLQLVANEIMQDRPELLISVKGIDYSVTVNG